MDFHTVLMGAAFVLIATFVGIVIRHRKTR